MSAPAMTVDKVAGAPPAMRNRQWTALVRAMLGMWRSRIGLVIVILLVLVALAGPLIAPHAPTEFITAPNSPPSAHALFGGDSLGRDVWSRFLSGGRSVLGLAVASTIVGVGVGLIVGLMAAYSGGLVDEVLMRIADVFMAFPQIVLALLLVSAFGPKLWLIVLTVGISHAPRVARVIRGAAQQVVERDFVKAAEAVGEPRRRIIFGELLPNVTSPLLVEVGLRLTYSIGLIAAINFLGAGLQPPSADWGLMISDNRLAVSVQPWAVLLPVLAIALLTIGTNLLTDGFARAAIGIDRGE
ncbi:MAG: ABC transporter permease [Actinomycetota bacterium]|nr:ABC transporter permease [Actinomycetota bacterium]